MGLSGYDLGKYQQELDGLHYYFISVSNDRSIYKVIEYTEVEGYNHEIIKTDKIYNLGFTDLTTNFEEMSDATLSANGDTYKVFYTILNTLPDFFQKYPDYAIVVTGSDSKSDFEENCFLNCRKRCKTSGSCKNKDRRVNIYRGYVNKNYDELNKEYTFFGGIGEVIEPFERYKFYQSVFVKKNKQYVTS